MKKPDKIPKEIQKIIDNRGKTKEEMRKLIVELEKNFDEYAQFVENLLLSRI